MAQEGEWNAPRALELIERARAARQEGRPTAPDEGPPEADSVLGSYTAQARGRVYFFVEREDTDERVLVRTDQVAVDLFWEAPDRGRQRIVGRRDRRDLPTNIRYHLDHLTVIQDDFGDRIRIGDGDEVESVVHPAAPASERIYDFRLADSLTLRVQPPLEQVRVYEVEVRPRDPEAPALVGSVFLDRESGAIVRMAFTFTSASYVDSYLDHIRIRLDNALWEGRWWLPFRQEVELRRELPQLDVPAATVIRGRWEIRDYELNPELPPAVMRGPRVTWAPEEELRAFPFEEGLLDEVAAEGLQPSAELEEIRAGALEAVGERYLAGPGGLRLHVPSLSDALRYDRAEGLFIGAGLSWTPVPSWSLRGHGGWAFGRDDGSVETSLTWAPDRAGAPRLGVEAYVDRLGDVGPVPGAAGLLNTLAGIVAEEDWTDPYFATGAALSGDVDAGPLRLSATLLREEHRSGRNVVESGGEGWRPVLPVEEGTRTRLSVRLARPVPAAGGPEAALTLASSRFEGRTYPSTEAEAAWTGPLPDGSGRLSLRLRGGWVGDDAPLQERALLGGRGTVPGHRYRGLAGEGWWLARAEGSRSLAHPWVTGRLQAALGGTSLDDPLPPPWPAGDGTLFAVGAGAGLGWDILHLDLWRGVDGGGWEWVISVDRRFRGLL